MYRQGDLLIVQVTELPRDARVVDHGVLAHGEATGHMHTVLDGAEQLVARNGDQYVRVFAERADVVHQEHGPVHLPGPAIYRVIRQREYWPGSAQRVLD